MLTFDGSNGTWQLPSAAMIRPQLASCPNSAVLTRLDETTALASFCASSWLPEPETATSKNLVAPSPSLAIDLASDSLTKCNALLNTAKLGSSTLVIVSFPANP